MVVIHEQQQIKLEQAFHLHQPEKITIGEYIKKWIIRHTYFDVRLDALILKKRALASEATAFAYEKINKSLNRMII